jgi:hypothetical protein
MSVPEWVLRAWAEAQTTRRLREIADGMPYRHEARKAEVVAWLVRYRPDAVARAREEQ